MEKVVRPTRIVTESVPVIGYLRVSTWREEKISDEIQKAVITEATARRGRYVKRWIADLDATGRNFKRKIMEGIGAVEAGEVSEIWVWKFSRFGRNRHGVAINLARIEQVGGQLVSATEDVDASTAVGEFTRDMLFAIAAFESNRAGEQWRETHELRRNAGIPATGGKRFGYRWFPRRVPDSEGGWTVQDERYEVRPEAAELMLHAYRENAAGRIGFGKIAALFNASGHLNTRGALWSDTGVRTALDSGFSAGLLLVHRHDVRCGNRGACRKWREHYAYRPAEHEGIITGDEWDAYRARRDGQSRVGWKVTPSFPLTGLTRCGLCGAAAVANTGGRAKVPGYSYRCRAQAQQRVTHESIHVLRSKVEDQVHAWLVELQGEIDAAAAGKTAEAPSRPFMNVAVQRDRLSGEIAKLAAALDRATEGNVMGDIPRDSYLRTRDKLVKQRGEREAELAALDVEDQAAAGPSDHSVVVRGLVDDWDFLAVGRKRELLARLIRRVDLGRGTIDVVPTWAPL